MGLLAPGPETVDEVWQLSKDSADAATANTQTQQRSRKAVFDTGLHYKHGNTRKVFNIHIICVMRAVREKEKSRINTVTELLSPHINEDYS